MPSAAPSAPPPARPARILHAVATVGAMTAVSRVAGFVREFLMAVCFGTSVWKSAFNIAFQIPNLFRRLLGEGALSAAFVPVFTDALHGPGGHEEANRLAARVAGLLVALLTAVTALGMLLVLALQHWCVPPDSRWAAILPLLLIMLGYAPLICLAALAMGILNALRSFAIPALAPVFLNLIMIGAIILGSSAYFPNDPRLRIQIVAWSVLLAGFVQVAVQLLELVRHGIHLRLMAGWAHDPGIHRIARAMAPMVLGVSVFQINVAVDGFIAMWAAEWAPAALGYAETIAYLPLGLIGTAFGTVLLPTFSHQVSENDNDSVRATLEHALRSTLLITAPVVVILTILALPTIRLLYVLPHGKFTDQDAIWTMRALAAFAPGILFFSVQKVLTPAFYALKDTRTPTRIALGGVALNFALNILFVITWPQGWKHVGLVVSTVLVSILNCVVLWRTLHHRIGAPRWNVCAPTIAGVALAMLGMSLAAWETHVWLLSGLHAVPGLEHPIQRLAASHSHIVQCLGAKIDPALALCGAMLIAMVVYLLLCRLLCGVALRDVITDFRHRKEKPAAPAPGTPAMEG